MAKTKGNKQIIGKMKFGKKKTGIQKKSYGPKEQKPKAYIGQGRWYPPYQPYSCNECLKT